MCSISHSLMVIRNKGAYSYSCCLASGFLGKLKQPAPPPLPQEDTILQAAGTPPPAWGCLDVRGADTFSRLHGTFRGWLTLLGFWGKGETASHPNTRLLSQKP